MCLKRISILLMVLHGITAMPLILQIPVLIIGLVVLVAGIQQLVGVITSLIIAISLPTEVK